MAAAPLSWTGASDTKLDDMPMLAIVWPAGETKEEGELSEAEAEAEAEGQASDEPPISLSFHTGRLFPRSIAWHREMTVLGIIGLYPVSHTVSMHLAKPKNG